MITLLGTLGTISLMVLFYGLARISERFGAVVKLEPHYRYYYVAIALLGLALLTQLIVANTIISVVPMPDWLMAAWFLLVAYHIPAASGVTVGLAVTVYYWRWLLTERP